MASRHDDWNTPREILDPIQQFWPSGIDLDPCSNATSIVQCERPIVEPTEEAVMDFSDNGPHVDGLASLPWWQRTSNGSVPCLTYVNPPYSKPSPWVERAAKESATGLCHVIMLIPSTCATDWWQRWVWPHAAAVGFMRKRVAFLDENGRPVSGNRFETALVYHGPEGQRFSRVFHPLAEVVRPGGWS